MNRHGLKTERKEIFFRSFKGTSKTSSLDQITLPPSVGLTGMWHNFGEWLKRGGNDWEDLSEKRLCELAVEYWNDNLYQGDLPRRFDRMLIEGELPQLKGMRS